MAKDKSFQEESDDAIIAIPKEERNLNTASYDYSVDYIATLMMAENAKIILEVPFQRKQVWKEDRSSQLIESILMNVPIPPLYFAEQDDGKWLVVDGLQRLLAIKKYYENEYKLKKLDILEELEGVKFKDMPQKPKDQLKDGQLRINVIKKDSHPDIKYDIFMRLNQGAVTLNSQELRNCLYRGDLNDLLKKIAADELILRLLNQKKPHDRSLDIEFLIRFLAFNENLTINNQSEYSINNYSGSLKTFLNTFMETNKFIKPAKLVEYKEKILDTFRKVEEVFGDDMGLRFPITKSRLINRAYADCILLSFARLDIELLKRKRSQIIATRNKLKENDEFKQVLLKRTSDHTSIKTRLELWFKEINYGICK